jgi:phenylacetate-CoA ligase
MPDEQPSLGRRIVNTAFIGVMAWRQRRVPFLPIEQIQRLGRHRLRSIIAHAYRTVPFYRRSMDERHLCPADFPNVGDLAKLPLLDSSIVAKDPAQFLSSQYVDRTVFVARSGGTTSHVQRVVYWDHPAMLRRLAYNERDRAVINALAGKGLAQTQLFLLPDVSISYLTRQFWDDHILVPRRLAHRVFVSPERPFEEIIDKINAIRPDVVFSYGSFADEFFRMLEDRRSTIALPRVWIYGGDRCSLAGRRIMEQTFGCPVYSTYQAVETGKIGFQCERREGFHINIDLCAVRLIDESGSTVNSSPNDRTVCAGAEGEIVVSNLCNRAMVLLNYRMGDIGVLSDRPCPCGRSLPVLDQLKGRTYEVLRLPDGRRYIADVLEMMFQEQLRGAYKVQAIQVRPDKIVLRIVPGGHTDCAAMRQAVIQKARQVLGGAIETDVEFVSDIPSSPAGKFQRLVPACAAVAATALLRPVEEMK